MLLLVLQHGGRHPPLAQSAHHTNLRPTPRTW